MVALKFVVLACIIGLSTADLLGDVLGVGGGGGPDPNCPDGTAGSTLLDTTPLISVIISICNKTYTYD